MKNKQTIKALIIWVSCILSVCLAVYQIFSPSFENLSEKNLLVTQTEMKKYMDVEKTVGVKWYKSGSGGSFLNPRYICYYVKVNWLGDETFIPVFDTESSTILALKMGGRKDFQGLWKRAPLDKRKRSSFGNVGVCLSKYFMGDKGKILDRVKSSGDIWFYDYGHSVALIDNSRKVYESIQIRIAK